MTHEFPDLLNGMAGPEEIDAALMPEFVLHQRLSSIVGGWSFVVGEWSCTSVNEQFGDFFVRVDGSCTHASGHTSRRLQVYGYDPEEGVYWWHRYSDNGLNGICLLGDIQGTHLRDSPTDDLRPMAEEVRGLFVPWIATHYPELGITPETDWVPTIVRPDTMVVMFYLFLSAEWEMGVSWHVTREPDNWARIYLRRRFSETHPSHGFQILSWSMEGEVPDVVNLQDPQYFMTEVWR